MVLSKKPLHFFIAALVAFLPLVSSANPTNDTVKTATTEATHAEAKSHDAHADTANLTEDEKAELERKAYVKHHLLDSHDFTLFSYGKDGEKHFGFPLPVILWDNGIHFFSSSKFEHGEAVAESKGNYYKIDHHNGKIYKTDAEGTFTEDEK